MSPTGWVERENDPGECGALHAREKLTTLVSAGRCAPNS